MPENLPDAAKNRAQIWPQVRKLLVLQLKLYIDAFRDICISALALGAFIIDLVRGLDGPDCYFEQIMKLGRRTEQAINLFNQHDPADQNERNVDSILRNVEDRLRR